MSENPRKRIWIGAIVFIAAVLICLGFAFNPIGEFKVQATERRIAHALKELPRGSDPETVRQFAIRQGLDPGKLSDGLSSHPVPPANTKYQIRAADSYVAGWFLGSSYVIVDFSFDKDKRFISAEISRLGSSL